MLVEEGKSILRTFDEWKETFLQDMANIRRMERVYTIFGLMHLFQLILVIGRHCYQTEEELSVLELHTLKRDLEISEPQWRWYKLVSVKKTSSRSGIFFTMKFLCQALYNRHERYPQFYSQLAQYKR